MLDVLKLLVGAGIRVVVDVDDLCDAIDRSHSLGGALDPDISPGRNWDVVERACEIAAFVTASTPAVAERSGRQGSVVVLPNRVPEWYLEVQRDRLGAVGWSGSAAEHPGDLEVIGDSISRVLAKRPDWRFAVIGPARGVRKILSLEQVISTGWVPFAHYLYRLAELGVGIVPLADNDYN
jgi:hypothetical protein